MFKNSTFSSPTKLTFAPATLTALAILLVFVLSATARAEEPSKSAIVSGDAAAGQTLYEAQCTVCHGVAGASAVPTQPILSGQHAEYTAAELRKFRSNERKNPIMSPMSTNLSDEDIANLAVYLAEQKPAIAGANDLSLAQSGEKLYRGGDLAAGIPACAACHNPVGAGIAPLYPRISGQYAEYVASSLREYANGSRSGDAMNSIAAELSEEQINALAAYISGLAP